MPTPIGTTADGQILYSDGSRKPRSTSARPVASSVSGGTVYKNASGGLETRDVAPTYENFGPQVATKGVSDTRSSGSASPVSSGGHYWSSEEDYQKDLAAAREAGYTSAEEFRNAQNAVKNTITSGFSNIRGRLDDMAGLVPGQQQEDESLLGEQVSGLTNSLASARDNSVQRISGFRDDVNRRAAESTEDVAGQLRQLLQASRRQLGVLGGSDSSASAIGLPFALGKQAAQAGAQIARGANNQMSELDQKEIDVQDTYQTALAETEQFRINSLQQIRDRARAAVERINQLRIQADESELQALSSLQTQVLSAVSQQLAQAEANAEAQRQSIQQWALNRMSQLNDFKLEMNQSGNFNPRDLVFNELQGLGGLRGQQGAGLINLGVRRRGDEEL